MAHLEIYKLVKSCWRLIVWLGLVFLPISVVAQTTDVLFLLDADRSRIFRFDPSNGTLTDSFTIPVVCQPEGACGLAYNGHSLFFVDATDLSQRIYELNPVDGTIWNSFPAPAVGIDGLAFDNGILYAVSFDTDQIYQIDTFDGKLLGSATVEADLIGGLGAGDGRLFATNALEAEILEIDPSNGAILQRFSSPSDFPTGLAVLDGHLFTTDFGVDQLYQINLGNGSTEKEYTEFNIEFLAALASGPPLQEPSYDLQLTVAEEIALETEVEFVVRVSLFDATGRLFETNDASRVSLAILSGTGDLDGGSRQRVKDGKVDVIIRVPLGDSVHLEASIAGMSTRKIVLGAVPLAGGLQLRLEPNVEDNSLMEVSAEILDVFGQPVEEDTSRVHFAVVAGRGVIIGASDIVPIGGRASTTIRLLDAEDHLEVVAQVRDLERRITWRDVPVRDIQAPAVNLTISQEAVAGEDNLPPEPARQLVAERIGERVDLNWELSPEDGHYIGFSFGGMQTQSFLVRGYQLFRSKDDGLFVQIGQVHAGISHFEDFLGVEPDAGFYRYKVVVDDGTYLREVPILSGSEADLARSVVIGRDVAVDAAGEVVQGLFSDDDLTVDFNDFFLFADNFGQVSGAAEYDARFDIDGDGEVGFGDFFIFADNFGRTAIAFDS